MEKIKPSPIEAVKNAIILVLTLSMLFFALAYIGGSQSETSGAAKAAVNMPSGAVKIGEKTTLSVPLYEKELLPISTAAIRYGTRGGSAYAGTPAAKAIFSLAAEHIHEALSQKSVLNPAVNAGELISLSTDYIALNLTYPLPYQAIYALTGEYDSVAKSETAASIDRLFLIFDREAESFVLFLSDGESFFAASEGSPASAAELSALASDSRLAEYELSENGIILCDAPLTAQKTSFSVAVSMTSSEQNALLGTLGYRVASENAHLLTEEREEVSPLGVLKITSEKLSFSAAQTGGIAISGFLPQGETAQDTGDILLAVMTALERIRAAAPSALSRELSLVLSGLYYENGLYTVCFSPAESGIAIGGAEYPHFARITVRAELIEEIELRFLAAESDSQTDIFFPLSLGHSYSSGKASIRSILPLYRISRLHGGEKLSPEWLYTVAGGEAK